MRNEEIVKALRCSATKEEQKSCDMCQRSKRGCFECINSYLYEAASLIEQMTAENAELRKEIEWKDMVIALAQRKQVEAEAERDALIEQIKDRHDCRDCKHNDFCDFDSYTFLDCMHCVPEVCPCAGCFDSSRWEWRGLPEEPEEGEKA